MACRASGTTNMNGASRRPFWHCRGRGAIIPKMSAKSASSRRPSNFQHMQWSYSIWSMVVRKPELTQAAIRSSMAASHMAISPPRDRPAQPIRARSTSFIAAEIVDGAHEVAEPLAGQQPAGLVDDVLADVDGDGDVARPGQLGREPFIDARPVVDDEARAAVAVDGHDRGIGGRARSAGP